MLRRQVSWAQILQLLLLILMSIPFIPGSPTKWRNIEINSTQTHSDDPAWSELVLWSNESMGEGPVLTSFGRNRSTTPQNQTALDSAELAKVMHSPENAGEIVKFYWRDIDFQLNYTRLAQELEKGVKSNETVKRYIPKFLEKTLRLLSFKQVVLELETSVMSKVSCTACRAGLLLHYIRAGKTADDVTRMSNKVCVSLKIQTPRVCDGVTKMFGKEVTEVLRNVSLGAKEICSFIIGDACGEVDNPTHEWEVVFPPVPKPPVTSHILPFEATKTAFKVLQLSDTHLDPYYEEGSNAECNEPLCCRLASGVPAKPEDRAGQWGDYRRCDIPKKTIEHMFKHISITHPDIDYILWTGDLPPHDIWNQTREENLSILKQTVAQMSSLFPGIPIFPALGNHETSPVNSFPPPFVQSNYVINWLYDELDKHWRQWLPISASKTVRKGAFYSVLIRPGFRIISLNMNYCNNKNWWLIMNSKDPAKELQWFIYELQSAELNNEKVHVIGHIPPGHPDCLKVWSRNYYSIISRYESTITSQFFGHTHYDEFQIFYDPKNLSRAVGIAYICPSVTSFIDLNPGYRIYYVDGDRENSSRQVLDHETWVMDLKEANLYGKPAWYKLYSAKKSYDLYDLKPQDWSEFVYKMIDNENLFNLYYKHYWKNSPHKPECDLDCRKRLICDLQSARSHDRKVLCRQIESLIDKKYPSGWRAWLHSGLSYSYVIGAFFPCFSWLLDAGAGYDTDSLRCNLN